MKTNLTFDLSLSVKNDDVENNVFYSENMRLNREYTLEVLMT